MQGDSPQQLARIKSVVQFVVYAAYRQRLETALLADQTTSTSAAAVSMEPPLGSSDASSPESPFQAAAEQAVSAASAVQSPLLQEEAPQDSKAAAAAAVVPADRESRAAAWSEQHRSRSAEAARDIVQASAQLAAQDRRGKDILSCSPHVTCCPADATGQPAAFAGPEPNGGAAAVSQQPTATAGQQPAADSSAGSADPGASAAASPPGSVPASPRPFAAMQRMSEAQRLFMSTACRNPTKKLQCEPPTVQVIRIYESGGEIQSSPSGLATYRTVFLFETVCRWNKQFPLQGCSNIPLTDSALLRCCADKPLAAFLAGAFPAPDRKCTQPMCGDGATHHLRTFVHSGQRVTLSVAQLPAGQELPDGDRGQVRITTSCLAAESCCHVLSCHQLNAIKC